MICELDVTHIDSMSPLLLGSCRTLMSEHEVSQPPIVSPPPDVEMTDNTAPILYLSSSMGSVYWDCPDISYCDYIEPSLMNTLVLTLVEVKYTSHSSPRIDNAHLNLASHKYASSSSFSSPSLSSSSPPIFHYNEDIMEAMITLYYPLDDMHHCAYFLP